MKKFLYPVFFLVFASCTTTITMTDTHGKSSDVVDENANASADVSPEVSVPIKPL